MFKIWVFDSGGGPGPRAPGPSPRPRAPGPGPGPTTRSHVELCIKLCCWLCLLLLNVACCLRAMDFIDSLSLLVSLPLTDRERVMLWLVLLLLRYATDEDWENNGSLQLPSAGGGGGWRPPPPADGNCKLPLFSQSSSVARLSKSCWILGAAR